MSNVMVQEWEIPPKSLGTIPDVTPGSSGGKVVEGDFPLDQVVTDSPRLRYYHVK
jgi:hypothetical protein